MKLRTQLIIAMVFFVVVIAVISASMIATNQQIKRLENQEELLKNIELKISELGYLSNDYLLYGESQQIDRWESKYNSVSYDVSNLTVDRPDQLVLVDSIKTNQLRLKRILDDIVSEGESSQEDQPSAFDPAFVQVSSSRLAVQSQGIMFDASRLSQLLREQEDQADRRNELLIIILMGAFIAFLLTNYLLIYRRTLESMSTLQAGTRIIGSGNLDHSIAEKEGDEFGELAKAFNRMTVNLKTVTASKADLEREIVEHKRAEEALRKSEERYRVLAENSDDFIYIIRRDDLVEYVNNSAASSLGLLPEDIIGKPRSSFFSQEVADGQKRGLDKAFETANIVYSEGLASFGNGWIWQDTHLIPLKTDAGEVYAVLGISRDITERKQIEKELIRLASFPKLNPNPIVEADLEGYVHFQNPAAQRLLSGLQEMGRDHPWLSDWESAIQMLRQSETSTYVRDVSIGDNWYQQAMYFLPDTERIRIYSIDITERKAAEEERQRLAHELADSVAELRAVLNAAPVAVWIAYDPQCRKIIGNDYADRILQAPHGGNVSRSALPEDAAITYKVLRNGIELQPEEMPAQVATTTARPVMGDELELVFPDGRTVHLIESAVPLLDSEGHVRGAIITGSDVTRLKLAEEKLRKSKDELEIRVHERTDELSQVNKKLEAVNITLIDEIKGHKDVRAKLQQEIEEHKQTEEKLLRAKEAAEAAAKTKAEFLANMSHEIRTPMNSVIGFTELLLDEPLSPEQKENLEAIRINGQALLTIINDILDFSKMESDKVVLEEFEFNLRQCVEESLDLVSIKASEKGLNLSYTIDKGVPETIIGDPGRLRQVLGNLLSNAVKFTDEGEVTVSVSSQQIDGINEVHFAVQDTGIGISQDSLNKLFQAFTQANSSTTRLYGGTGLGLAISKKLVEMMDGKIWAESQEGVGSTFHFTIRAPSEQVEPKLAVVSPQLIGKSALIVEDNKTNRRILSRQVYEWGMVPMAAKSAQEALNWVLRGDDFDVAILDMDLKDMDALELEEKICKYNKTLPLVLLTSIGKRVPPNHAYLTKPIKPSQMHNVLTDILPRTGILSVQPDQETEKASEADPPIQNSSLRILLAEDNVSSQKVAQQMLKKLGYKADVVANGIEVLQSLERQHYDVVLMDVRMPEMDGLEATRIIRQRWPDNGPKIIAITAYALEGDREKCLEAGMDGYIAKPIQKGDLAETLKKYAILSPPN